MNTGKSGRIYCEKKDVLIIYRNEPLLFVHGPPVFIKVAIQDEESTSVFILNGEELEGTVEVEQEVQEKREVGASTDARNRMITVKVSGSFC